MGRENYKSRNIVLLITLAGSAIGTFASIGINSKLSNYRIEQLEKK